MFWAKYPALSPGIIAELQQELRVLKAQRKSVEVEMKQSNGKRKYDFEKAARFFVGRLPSSKDMQIHMAVTKMCVYQNMKRPEMINAVRALGYDGEVTLRQERRGRPRKPR